MKRIRYIEDLFKKISTIISDFTDNFDWHEGVYLTILRVSYILFFIAFTGVFTLDPAYLITLENIIKYYISIILIIRFNPFVERKVTKFDRRLVFSSAVFLFISTAAFTIATNYLKNLKLTA